MKPDDQILERLAVLSQQATPQNQAQLNERVASIAAAMGIPVERARRLLAAVIVTQMLPEGTAVKGGIGVKIRAGETGTRATRDLDVSSRDRGGTVEELTVNLEKGWGEVPASKTMLKKDPNAAPRVAFFGNLKAESQATPTGVPPQYVLEPYAVRLCFLTEKNVLASVPLEIGVDEFDGTTIAPAEPALSRQVAAAVAALGCGTVAPVSVISIEQQLAQKIHAVTDPSEDRGHDLIDIQVLWQQAIDLHGEVDLPALADLCRRTFEYRAPSRALAQRPPHTWPPSTEHVLSLSAQYETALEEVSAGLESIPAGIAPDIEHAEQSLRRIVAQIEAV